MEKDKIELKTVMETADVADYLTALAKGFRAGRIVIEKDGEHLVLSPAAMSKAEVEIEARIKKDKAKFSLELCWLLASEEEAAGFNIGTELPDPDKAEDKKDEYKKLGDKKPEDNKAEGMKPAPQAGTTTAATAAKPAAPDAKPAHAQAKSDVKTATAPAVNEPGGKAVVAASAQAKPKA